MILFLYNFEHYSTVIMSVLFLYYRNWIISVVSRIGDNHGSYDKRSSICFFNYTHMLTILVYKQTHTNSTKYIFEIIIS
jgi:hypothetical protein